MFQSDSLLPEADADLSFSSPVCKTKTNSFYPRGMRVNTGSLLRTEPRVWGALRVVVVVIAVAEKKKR